MNPPVCCSTGSGASEHQHRLQSPNTKQRNDGIAYLREGIAGTSIWRNLMAKAEASVEELVGMIERGEASP